MDDLENEEDFENKLYDIEEFEALLLLKSKGYTAEQIKIAFEEMSKSDEV